MISTSNIQALPSSITTPLPYAIVVDLRRRTSHSIASRGSDRIVAAESSPLRSKNIIKNLAARRQRQRQRTAPSLNIFYLRRDNAAALHRARVRASPPRGRGRIESVAPVVGCAQAYVPSIQVAGRSGYHLHLQNLIVCLLSYLLNTKVVRVLISYADPEADRAAPEGVTDPSRFKG